MLKENVIMYCKILQKHYKKWHKIEKKLKALQIFMIV